MQAGGFVKSACSNLLILAGLAIVLAACSRREGTIAISGDDVEMNAAIAKARETLPEFWNVFDHREHGETEFSLKVKITDSHGTEHFWTDKIERRDGKIFGTIDNDAEIVKSVKLGQRLDIPEADISDWFYMRDGLMHGNRTLKVLIKHMPAQEAAKYKPLFANSD